MITIELFGVPRLRGRHRPGSRWEALDVGSAILELGRACPMLVGTVLRDGLVQPAYKLSLNGDRFVTEPATTLVDGDVLLLLAADVGGMTRMSGYHGRYLRVDPRAGRSGCVPLDDRTLREFVGGSAWVRGSWPAKPRPVSTHSAPDAPIVFAMSPMVGSPLTTSAKFAVVAIGPLNRPALRRPLLVALRDRASGRAWTRSPSRGPSTRRRSSFVDASVATNRSSSTDPPATSGASPPPTPRPGFAPSMGRAGRSRRSARRASA